jgi:ATP-dependent DNA ligase
MSDDDPESVSPMEAALVERLPDGPGWQFEPKWDGFRAIAAREGDRIEIHSKSGKPLGRYFPEVVAALADLAPDRFMLDGELILPIGDVLSFAALQARLHPAASRIERLSRETPAQLMLFDCLAIAGDDLAPAPLRERRAALDRFYRTYAAPPLLLSPFSYDLEDAEAWLAASGGALDGVVAKRLDGPYQPGERAMLKIKQHRTAECVVGGFRTTNDAKGVASLLLGLYDAEGRLNHIGFTSSISAAERVELLEMLAPLRGGSGFTGNAPGGPSRWNRGRETEWEPVRPELVVEVLYDQVTGGRFRHGTRLLRWRPDKAPSQCTADQLVHELRPAALGAIIDPTDT